MSVDEIINGIAGNLDSTSNVDVIRIAEQVETIQSIANTILGLLVVLLVVGVQIVFVVEIVYINLPAFQLAHEKLIDKTEGKTNRVLGLVLRDARRALKRANTLETGKSVNRIYLGMKIKSIIVVAIIVGIIMGAGSYIVEAIVKIVISIIN